MLEVRNPTPYPVRLVPWLDPSGRQHAVVVAKATYQLERGGLSLADEQVPVRLVDEHVGEPGASSVRYEADTAPEKAGTDVVFVATAHAPSEVPYLDVQLVAGPLERWLRVFGDRTWQRGRPSAPRPFRSLPLLWERAFGGADPEDPTATEPRNPVGVGLAGPRSRALDGRPLPNLEDPHQPLQAPGERPEPAGVGFVSRAWPVRARLAGTLDAAYRRDRAPLLPLDFDPRYFQAAPRGWTSRRPFVGGERIYAGSVLPGGRAFDAALPALSLAATVTVRGARDERALAVDTIVVEPAVGRVEVTARASFPVPKSLLEVELVRVREVRG